LGKLGVWFSLAKPLRLRLSTSHPTRFPTLHQLYGSDSGNPDLNPEQALKLEGGVEFDVSSNLQVKVDLFRNNVKDLIDRKGHGYQYTNLNRVILQGIEAGLEGRVKERFNFNFNYAHLDAYEDETEYWLPYSPSHKIDCSLSYAFKFGLSVYSSGQYVSKRVTPHPESELLPYYFVVNLRVTQKLKGGFCPFVEIKNLLDVNYEEEKEFPALGRTSLLGVKIVF